MITMGGTESDQVPFGALDKFTNGGGNYLHTRIFSWPADYICEWLSSGFPSELTPQRFVRYFDSCKVSPQNWDFPGGTHLTGSQPLELLEKHVFFCRHETPKNT